MCSDLQVHQLQQNHDPTVFNPGALCQGLGRLRCHVLHHLLGFHTTGLSALWNPGQGLQQFPGLLVSHQLAFKAVLLQLKLSFNNILQRFLYMLNSNRLFQIYMQWCLFHPLNIVQSTELVYHVDLGDLSRSYL